MNLAALFWIFGQCTWYNEQTLKHLQGSLQWADQHSQFCLMTTPDRKKENVWAFYINKQLDTVHLIQRSLACLRHLYLSLVCSRHMHSSFVCLRHLNLGLVCLRHLYFSVVSLRHLYLNLVCLRHLYFRIA